MNKLTRLRCYINPKSLRFQLILRSLLLISVLLAVIGLFQYVLMREFIYQSKASSLQSQVLTAPPDAWELMQNNAPVHGPGPNRFPFFLSPDATIAFIDNQGNYSVPSDSSSRVGEPPKLSDQDYRVALQSRTRLNYKVVNQTPGGEQLVVLQPIQSRGHLNGLIQVSVSTNSLNEVLVRQLLIFLSLALLALTGGMFAFAPLIRKTLVPLSNMVDTVEKIDSGNLAERFPVEQGQIEIDRLGVSFNGMLERLEASFEAEKEAKEQMQRFVADASHELRTPLTSIHGFLEVLLRGAMKQPEQLQKSLNSMYTEAERMKKLVQDLLLLAKLDRTPKIKLCEEDLDAVIKKMEPQLRMLAGNRQVTFLLNPNSSCRFDEDKIKQVLLNLFQNAVQHTDPEKGHIEVSVEVVPDGVRLTVKDNGSGIPEEHLPHVFDRFYRSESSRNRKYGGAGLGLSITKSIVDIHGGLIKVESKENEGSSFNVWLLKT